MALSVCNSTTDPHQKELLEHGTRLFPIACYDDDLSANRVPWHWHEEWEFNLVEEGTAVVLLENTQVSIPAGSGVFINSGVLHTFDYECAKNAIVHSGVFHPRLIGGSADSVYWNELVLPLTAENAPGYVVLEQSDPVHAAILENFRRVWSAVTLEWEDYENLARYLLSKACRSLCQNLVPEAAALSAQERVDVERIRSMLAFIDANIASELSVKRIAESVSISESVCLRCFHRTIGMTPMQYVKQSRLDRAAALLCNTSMTATAVAIECGFCDISYFTKSFREKMGCTPKEYRNKR